MAKRASGSESLVWFLALWFMPCELDDPQIHIDLADVWPSEIYSLSVPAVWGKDHGSPPHLWASGPVFAAKMGL